MHDRTQSNEVRKTQKGFEQIKQNDLSFFTLLFHSVSGERLGHGERLHFPAAAPVTGHADRQSVCFALDHLAVTAGPGDEDLNTTFSGRFSPFWSLHYCQKNTKIIEC